MEPDQQQSGIPAQEATSSPADEQQGQSAPDLPVAPLPEPLPPSPPAARQRHKISAIALFASTFLLFLFVVALLILALSVNPAGQVNPVLQFFGQNEDTVKDFLLKVVNMSFGFFSVFLLIVISLTLVLGFSQPKDKKQKRAALFAFSLVASGLQIVTLFSWFGMYNLVLALAAPPDPNRGEIVMFLPDEKKLSPPVAEAQMAGVTTSTELTFSAKDLIRKHEALGNKVKRISWDKGEGDFSVGIGLQEITTTFPRTGEHKVRVNLLIDNGTDDAEVIKEIAFFIPRAHIRLSPEAPLAGQKVQFDATNLAAAYPGKKILEWDFNNDNRPDAEEFDATTEYTYTYPGNYQVALKLKDSKGLVHTFDWPVVIGEPKTDLINVVIDSEPRKTDPQSNELVVEIGTAVKFDGTASNSPLGEIIAFEWNVSPGENQPRKTKAFVHTFKEEGIFEVVLKVTDAQNNEDETSMLVRVTKKSAPPVAKLRVLKPAAENPAKAAGRAPFTIELDASESSDANNDISAYEWDADGDGTFEPEKAGQTQVSHTYTKGGVYKAAVRVVDREGQSSIASVRVTVEEIKLTASAKALATEASAPDCEIGFDASASKCSGENCRIEAYEWEFGDGGRAFLSVPTVEHLYNRLGSFVVKLTVHGKQDDEDKQTLTATDTVTVYCRETALSAVITPSRTAGNAPVTISFSSVRSTGNIGRYLWDFGDGFTSEDPITEHRFERPGEYPVTLTVFDRQNSFAKSTVIITAHPQ